MLFAQVVEPSAPPAHQREPEAQPPQGLYIISVAARILSMHPQTLRKYERVGLVSPSRTVGMLRLYSEEDIVKLRVIKRLVEELRLNLAGVEMAMAVFDRLAIARSQMAQSQANRRATTQAFDQMFEQIMELFAGPRR
jgi:MerR family transcriptional regulator, heat shock protein HspR